MFLISKQFLFSLKGNFHQNLKKLINSFSKLSDEKHFCTNLLFEKIKLYLSQK